MPPLPSPTPMHFVVILLYMLGFVLSVKMDDNYGQHACDSPSTGTPCVKQKFTIHNLLNLLEMATITELLFLSHVPSPCHKLTFVPQ